MLSNGVQMQPDQAEQAVYTALTMGYRSIVILQKGIPVLAGMPS